jgi:hypothetical protein
MHAKGQVIFLREEGKKRGLIYLAMQVVPARLL